MQEDCTRNEEISRKRWDNKNLVWLTKYAETFRLRHQDKNPFIKISDDTDKNKSYAEAAAKQTQVRRPQQKFPMVKIKTLKKQTLYLSIVSSSRTKRISGCRLITTQISEADHHSMHIGMEHDKSNKSHLLSALSNPSYQPFFRVTPVKFIRECAQNGPDDAVYIMNYLPRTKTTVL